jgi:hypothetical protein
LRTFLHVGEKKAFADPEHPFQGWLPYLKLVWQPSVQLLLVRSSSLSLAMTEPGAGVRAAVSVVVRTAGPLRYPAPVFADRADLCGLAACLGAATVTLGSVELGEVCDIAVPLRPHSIARAAAEDATIRDDIPMTRSLKRTRSISRSVRCILRISACDRFEIFHVRPAE